MPRRYQKGKRKPYRRRTRRSNAVARSAPKSKYRPLFIGSELQLTNRRPQSMTTRISVLRTYFVRPEVGVNNWSFIRIRCGSPFEPWDTGSGGQLQPGRWQIQSFVDSTIFDQFGALYEEGYVIGSKATAHVKFIGQRNIVSLESAPNQLQQVIAMGVQSSNDPNQGAIDPDDICSTVVKKQNFRTSRVLMGGNSNAGLPNANLISEHPTKQIQQSAYYSPKKLFGIKDVGDFENARFKMTNEGAGLNDPRIPPMYGDANTQYEAGPYFTLGLSHESDSLGGVMNRLNHNDAYVSIKVDYIIKMVKPTPDRGFNYRPMIFG